ncbi:hypothetical protein BDV95DRAFT_646753 [Massariosphaeria phaeospora]|uniref:NB-ARC domain-containing protein n=1 Tax=Massariosphaeria phaeospora TaxID=100035 RepID=A0A7C8MI87_9PLEO|nr:hypothetical protein BDV95DRAFT_646753 [Massariosphaeria phaeospora]
MAGPISTSSRTGLTPVPVYDQMVDPVTLISALAVVTQLLCYGVEGINAISDTSSRLRLAPETLQQWKDQARVSLNLVTIIEAQHSIQSKELCEILERCRNLVVTLESRIQRLSVVAGDNRFKKLKKAVKAVRHEKQILQTLSSVKETLACIQGISDQSRYIPRPVYLYSANSRLVMATQFRMSSSLIEDDMRSNKRFIGQNKVLYALSRMANPQSEGGNGFRRVTLTGLGGSGKSAVAREFAHRLFHASPDTLIFWLDGSSAPRFLHSIRAIFSPQQPDLMGVKNWLESEFSPPWLMIVDNAHMETFFGKKQLHRLLPDCSHGRIIFTSRNRNVARTLAGLSQKLHAVEMNGMDRRDASQLLLSYLEHDTSNEDDNDQLVARLELLPLSIVLVGLLISSNSMTVTNCLSYLKTDKGATSRLISDGLSLFRTRGHNSPEIATPFLSLEELKSQNPHAVPMLAALSCLDGQNIPESFFSSLWNPSEISGALSSLQAFSIVRQGDSFDTYSINPMLRSLIRSELKSIPEYLQYMESVLLLLDSHFPRFFRDYDSYRNGRYYSTHGADAFASEFTASSTLQNILGAADQHMGNYDVAAQIFGRNLRTQTILLGSDDMETIHSMNNYALALQQQGMFQKAENYHRKALHRKKALFGSTHPETLTTLNNLGLCIQSRGDHVSAESFFRDAIAGRERCLETDHPAALRALSNLGISLQLQQRYEEAEQLQRYTLLGRHQVLGPKHHETLRSKLNLAITLHYQQKWPKAEALLRQATADFEEVLGPDHPETLTVLENLGKLLRDQARYDEAEVVAVKVLSLVRQKNGDEHSQTLDVLQQLASLLHWQERYEEALELATRARNGRSQQFGTEDPRTQTSAQHVQLLEDYLQDDNTLDDSDEDSDDDSEEWVLIDDISQRTPSSESDLLDTSKQHDAPLDLVVREDSSSPQVYSSIWSMVFLSVAVGVFAVSVA